MPQKRGGPLRLVRSLRDNGTLIWGDRGERPVAYAIDLYSQGDMLSGDGDVRGDLTSLVDRAAPNLRLRLADGATVSVALSNVEPDGATIELIGPIPLQAT